MYTNVHACAFILYSEYIYCSCALPWPCDCCAWTDRGTRRPMRTSSCSRCDNSWPWLQFLLRLSQKIHSKWRPIDESVCVFFNELSTLSIVWGLSQCFNGFVDDSYGEEETPSHSPLSSLPAFLSPFASLLWLIEVGGLEVFAKSQRYLCLSVTLSTSFSAVPFSPPTVRAHSLPAGRIINSLEAPLTPTPCLGPLHSSFGQGTKKERRCVRINLMHLMQPQNIITLVPRSSPKYSSRVEVCIFTFTPPPPSHDNEAFTILCNNFNKSCTQKNFLDCNVHFLKWFLSILCSLGKYFGALH